MHKLFWIYVSRQLNSSLVRIKLGLIMKLNQIVTLKIIFVIFIVLIIWIGFFDKIALNYTNNSLKDAAVIYASARLINAVISVLQSTDT